MPSLILRPNQSVVCAWYEYPAQDCYLCVKEAIPDEDASYVYALCGVAKVESAYRMEEPDPMYNDAEYPIDYVRAWARNRLTTTGNHPFRWNCGVRESAVIDFTSVPYIDVYYDWFSPYPEMTPPPPWTWGYLRGATRSFFGLIHPYQMPVGTPTLRNTQYWIEVFYTPAVVVKPLYLGDGLFTSGL